MSFVGQIEDTWGTNFLIFFGLFLGVFAFLFGRHMLYAIIGNDNNESLPLRLKTRTDHLQRLQILQNEGRLILAGPFPAIDCEDPGNNGFTGSLIVAEFDSLEAAQSWAEQDPYLIAGVYKDVTVKPFKKVF